MADVIYVVEDDRNVSELVRVALVSFQYEVACFECAEDMLAACRAGRLPALLILDIMLPGMDGIAALRLLRAERATAGLPVILLTAKGAESERVTGLDNGADDYIPKPFGILELAARVRAVLRRRTKADPAEPEVLRHGDIMVDTARHVVTKDDQPVELTLKEYDLLLCLLRNARRVLTRDELLSSVWGYSFTGESRTLDMHIRSLRRKLGDDAEHPAVIKTVRGVGYTIVS